MKFKLLDCTLRDGGYYTNWDFDYDLVSNYFKAFNKLPVEYLEIGYRSNPMKTYLGEFFYCPPYLLERCKKLSDKKLVIILNEKDVRAEHVEDLLTPCKDFITMVRLAIDPKNFTRALVLAEAVKKIGFQVGFNVMYMSNWEHEKAFLRQIKNVDGIADFFYMVDSFGGVYPKDVKQTFNIVRDQVDVKIGFHGHNNMELGLINTLTAIECGASIVDSTVTGMGRGAGNLSTELLLTALNSSESLDVNFDALSQITAIFAEIKKNYNWGTNLPYMVSGANSLPQKQVMEWVSKRFYSFNSIIRALHNQKNGIEDNQEFPKFEEEKSYTEAIIIGGGPTAIKHFTAVNEYVKENPGICLIHASSRNAKYYKDLKVDQYFCLIGSEGNRLEKIFKTIGRYSGICILPPYPRKMGTYVPLDVVDSTYEISSYKLQSVPLDSPTVLAIELALKLCCKKISTVGYDGYSNDLIGAKEHELFLENDEIFNKYKKEGYVIKSLTPTKYKNIPVQSIYSKL